MRKRVSFHTHTPLVFGMDSRTGGKSCVGILIDEHAHTWMLPSVIQTRCYGEPPDLRLKQPLCKGFTPTFPQDPPSNPRLALQAAVRLSRFVEWRWGSAAALHDLVTNHLQNIIFPHACLHIMVCSHAPLQVTGKPGETSNRKGVGAEVRSGACSSRVSHHGLCVV